MAAGLWRALQTYRRAIPAQALACHAVPDGEWAPLDEVGWESVRKELLETPWPHGSEVRLQESHTEVGAHSFEYSGKWLDAPGWQGHEEAVSAAAFTLPTEFLLEHGPSQVRDLALALAAELPWSFGYVSPAFVSPGGLRSPAKQALQELCLRYPGLDAYNLRATARSIGTRARGAYWLTFLGQPLLTQLGGLESLRQRLPSSITLHPMDGERVLLRLGEWPRSGDATVQEDMSPYRALAQMLEPHLYQELTPWLIDEAFERRWLGRFL
ncbi:type VI immunity family protein [Pyxidicoccus sp. 3LG]